MKKLSFFRSLTVLFFTVFYTSTLFAQKDMVQFLAAGESAANTLSGYYIAPFLNTFGNNMNNGWYSTAEPLKSGRFTITIGATGSFIPKDEQTFMIDPAEYGGIIATTGNKPVEAQTMFGEKTSPTGIYAKYNSGASSILFPFNIPEGSGVNISPLPIAQFSIGIIKGTEIMLRGFPKFEIKGYKAGYLGIGIKHDIKQWIPVMSKMPFHLSFLGAYTSAGLDIVGGEFLTPETGVNNPNAMDYKTQQLNFSSSGWTANILISREFAVFTAFGGIGISSSKTKLDLKGNYPITILNTSMNKEIGHLVDPISLEGSKTQFGITGGFRLKFGIFAFFAEGLLSPGGYNSVSAGMNFGVFN